MSGSNDQFVAVAFSVDGTSALVADKYPYLKLVEPAAACAETVSAAPKTQHVSAVRPVRYQAWQVYLTAAIVGVALFAVMALADYRRARTFDSAIEDVAFERVTVHSGDSLWSLASSCEGMEYPTEMLVEMIQERNGLSTATLHPGDQIYVPQSVNS